MNDFGQQALNSHFTHEASASATITPVTDADLTALSGPLGTASGNDPYARSPAYYAMTGRYGLWQVEQDEVRVFLCAHPNVEDQMLVFPPIGDDGGKLLSRTLQALAASGSEAQLARFENPPPCDVIRARPIPEKILDWAYPVHVLDTHAVDALAGPKFQNIRTHLRRLDMSRITVRDIDPAKDTGAVMAAIHSWTVSGLEDVAPYTRLMKLFGCLPMAGRITFFDGRPAGVSIFECTDKAAGFANAYAHLAIHDINGLSRLVMVDMCRTLRRQGFRRVCIGGSETEGLDRFKRKFSPVASIVLSSWHAEPRPALRQNPQPVHLSAAA